MIQFRYIRIKIASFYLQFIGVHDAYFLLLLFMQVKAHFLNLKLTSALFSRDLKPLRDLTDFA